MQGEPQANPGQNGWAAAFTSPMTIIGSATVYSIYTSQELFNGQVTIEISTDGKFLMIGKLNFADNNLERQRQALRRPVEHQPGRRDRALPRRHARPGADPDPLREAADGLQELQGQDVAFTVPDLPPSIPTASLGGPADGATIASSELNGRGYIDVTYTVPTGRKLDDASITDLAPEFTIAVTGGPGTVKLDSSQAPIHLSGNTYRYWVLTQGTTSATTIALTPGDGSTSNSTWALDDATTGATNPNPTSASAAFTTVDISGLRTSYIDVGLAPTAGQTVDTSTLGAGDVVFTLDGSTTGRAADHDRRDADADSEHRRLPLLPERDVPRRQDRRLVPVRRVGRHGDAELGRQRLVHRRRADRVRRCAVQRAERRRHGRQRRHGPLGPRQPATGPHYIDVVYSPPTGTSLNYSTIYTSTHPTLTIGTQSITLGAPTAIEMVTDPVSGALVATAVSQTQAQTDNVTRFRYDFTSGNWAPGTATITVPTWSDTGGDAATQTTLTFEVLGPTVQLVQPTNGSGIDVNTINGRITSTSR